MRRATVSKIRNADPSQECFPFGDAIVVGTRYGSSNAQVGTATIEDVSVTDYQSIGVSVGGPTSSVTILRSRIVGDDGGADGLAVGAIAIRGATLNIRDSVVSHNTNSVSVLFSNAAITQNIISDNVCQGVGCGADPITTLQSAGVSLVGALPGTVVRENAIVRSDVAIASFYGSGTTTLAENAASRMPARGARRYDV